ncbi:MAG: isochorismatase family protein [Ignavibacteriae bacterium]|nr:isochorismatase family protein [Ignavibacteriota bacterium]
MKENYFKNIESKSNEFLSNIFLTPGYRRVSFDLRDSALLVIDMQNYFTEDASHAFIPAAKTIIKPINKLISLFRDNDKSIIFTRHINTVENANMLSKWWSDIITEGEMSEISNKFDIKGSKILVKSQYDAFYQTELASYLVSRGIKKLVITGVATHLCCETTARSAFVRGFEVFFPVDCTATYEESFHLATLRNLSHGFAHIVKSSDLIRQDKANE